MPVPGQQIVINPYWASVDGITARYYLGDVRKQLAGMPAQSVHCVVTSPPYWGLRDYGTATWIGGDENCTHRPDTRPEAPRITTGGRLWRPEDAEGELNLKKECPKCGAKRIDQQLGSEPSPDCGTHGKSRCGGCFICNMVAVFMGVHRVLRDDGTLWLNLGDTYSGGSGGYATESVKQQSNNGTMIAPRQGLRSMPSGNLVGIPWRLALALQANGWILRSDIPWVKRSAMPESVTNRPAKALEYVFLLTKKMGYYYDHEAIKPKSIDPESLNGRNKRNTDKFAEHDPNGKAATRSGFAAIPDGKTYASRNFRNADLWFQSVEEPHGMTGVGDEIVGLDITSESFKGTHFATFGQKLITPMILAGTSAKGCCARCGKPWRRVVEEKKLTRERPNEYVKYADQRKPSNLTGGAYHPLGQSAHSNARGNTNSCANTVAGVEVKTLGWEAQCKCEFYRLRDDVPDAILTELKSLGIV